MTDYDDYKPEYVPFAAPAVPKEKKKKKKEKLEEEEEPPRKKKEKYKAITDADVKTYTWQMERFQIMLADSKNVLVALMLDSEPSEPIKDALYKFTTQFENRFQTEIENFRGNVSWFRPATVIADDSFNMFLMQPQVLPINPTELKQMKLTDVESKVVRVAQDLSKETGYFFLATLLDEGFPAVKREKGF